MRCRLIACTLSLVMLFVGLLGNVVNANTEENIDFSYLLTNNTLIGYSDMMPRGVYLAEGNSIINKMSTNKIGAGGITNATRKCEVSITSIVERRTSTGWARVTSWTQTNEYAFSAVVSKSLIVGTGYYYRVRSSHYAGSDASSSCTSALFV